LGEAEGWSQEGEINSTAYLEFKEIVQLASGK
jgi:hypothetical protein